MIKNILNILAQIFLINCIAR